MLLIATCVLCSSVAFSQSEYRIGVKAGLNNSGYLGKDSESDRWQNLYGAHAGIVVNFPVTPKTFSIQPELQYSMKGAKNEIATNEKVRLHYIDVPVMAVFRAKFIFVDFGPYASILAAKTTDPKNIIPDGYLRRFSVGAAGGVGIQSSGGITLGIRYGADFNKLYQKEIPNRRNYHNSLLQIYAGYLFGGDHTNDPEI